MNTATIATLPGSPDVASPEKNNVKRSGAAKDFEALLIGQMLKSMREGTGGWLGADHGDADETAVSLG